MEQIPAPRELSESSWFVSEDEEDGEGVGMSPGRDGGMKSSRRELLEVEA